MALCQTISNKIELSFLAQGVSGAGFQGGLTDPRSGLVKDTFKVYDDLPEALEAQLFNRSKLAMASVAVGPRVALMLENVGALLSSHVETRKVWAFILKALL